MAAVLLVDDDFDSSAAIARVLSGRGHTVRHVPDGREALAELLGKLPDVVVLDLKMPVMSGVDFLDVLRSYLRFSALPVVLLTAFHQHADAERAQRLGVLRTFVKGKEGPVELCNWIDGNISRPPAVSV